MNYTIIGFTADSSYYDRCGDYIHQPAVFETFFTRDRSEFIQKWAEMKFSENFEELKILLNDVPDDHNDTETDELYYELQDLCNSEIQKLKDQKILQDRREAEAHAIREAEQHKLRAHLQRQKDLQQLEELKKKLGM